MTSPGARPSPIRAASLVALAVAGLSCAGEPTANEAFFAPEGGPEPAQTDRLGYIAISNPFTVRLEP